MQSGSFDPRMNPLPTHQVYQFPSQVSQNVSINNSCNPPNVSQLQPSNILINYIPPHSFSPDYESRLRDEVIYLHSLWHRGPPSTRNLPSQTPLFLRPSTPTPFKKWKKNSKTLKPSLSSDKEWPVDSTPKCPSPSGSSWPKFKPKSAPVSRPATTEERERVLAVKIHLKALDSCLGLFGKETSSDCEVEDEEEEDDVDDAEEYEFLMKVYEEDDVLRGYYEKHFENGEFYCLICGVIGNKLSRKYKNCVALVQHSVTISKTKKKAAHGAYGHVICKFLRWDINRLPSLQSAVEDARGQSSEKSCELQNESKVKADGCEADDAGGLKKDGVCCDSENVLLEQKNTTDSAPEVANKSGEGCSTLGSESVDCGASIMGDVA